MTTMANCWRPGSGSTFARSCVAFFAKYWFGKMPWLDQASDWARSPLSLVANVKTPTLIGEPTALV